MTDRHKPHSGSDTGFTSGPNSRSGRRNLEAGHSESYRGELYSLRLKNNASNSYFLNLKENREADIYLNIVESRTEQKSGGPQDVHGAGSTFRRHSILIFAEQREAFVSECLAALDALAENRDHCGQVDSVQRQFSLRTEQKKRNSAVTLVIQENSHHYGKPLQEQVQITQDCASAFSRAFIEMIEKWLEYEKQRPDKTAAPNVARKKVMTVRAVPNTKMVKAKPGNDGDNGDGSTV
ncbi:DUF3276 family protein [Candidatus Haliotispira prima]|uniref:DUF3276 family protein n=1 Tax=Candidatus Haliotispira prima TaxID=3034016 RepID=A0ABY8MED3_9SPIO|nr:DUF3276 family protein [Candidatus Haliotispira prima]